MAETDVHANTKQRVAKGTPALLACGALRAGALVTGDPSLVTCSGCQSS
jgi:hypothetical protein